MKRSALFFCVFAAFFARAENTLLPVDDAFSFTASVEKSNLVLRFDIADGYYLYRDKITFESSAADHLGDAQFSPAKTEHDEFFGEVQTYRDRAEILIPLKPDAPDGILLKVGYQGCADLGVCYPPVFKTAALEIPPPSAEKFAQKSAPPSGFFSRLMNEQKPQQPSEQPFNVMDDEHPLDPDAAFRFQANAKNASTIFLRFDIADDYYLYDDKFFFDIEGADFGAIDFPAGKEKFDEFFGRTEVHEHILQVDIPLVNIQKPVVSFTVKYQGCWEGGVCYPPQEKTVAIMLPDFDYSAVAADPAKFAPATPFTTAQNPPVPIEISGENFNELNETDRIANLLKQDSLFWILASFFGFGLLLSLTPCVFPMIPILSGIIIGSREKVSTGRAFLMSVFFVLAMSLTYAAFGVVAGYFGENLQIAFQNPWVIAFFSLVFVALAFSMFGYYDIQMPKRLQGKVSEMSNKQKSGSLLGATVMGFLSALIVGPCVAPPLAGALIYIGQTGDAVLGGASLFVMSLGMGAILIAVGTGVSKTPKAGGWMETVKHIFGVLMLAVAIYLLDRIIPDLASLILWATLFTIAPVAMGALVAQDKTSTPWQRIFKAVGMVILGYGILLWLLVARGGGDMLAPLSGWGFGASGEPSAKVHVVFDKIKTTEDLDRVIAAGENSDQLVMLDFYADWCIACKEIERFVFSDPAVVAALQNTIAVQADVTENDADDKALMRRFDIIGPPAILFFQNGEEVRRARIIGELGAREFLETVNSIR